MTSNRITGLRTVDVRFPTSEHLDGSDAMNPDPDYSAAYVILETERGDQGYGHIFTIGRGTDLCCAGIEAMRHLVIGTDLEEIKAAPGDFYDHLRSDSQIRWLGPEKGVVHMAMGAVMNAVWDLWARTEGKPVWRLLTDMTPEQFVDCIDLRYLGDVLTRDEALAMVSANECTKVERAAEMASRGYPCYTTSAGWLGYPDDKMRILCQEALDNGFKHLKFKVGRDLEDDKRRLRIAREVLGDDVRLMIDANQVWEVPEAIEWTNALAEFKPWFIEEPTSPDDVLGHKAIREAIHPIGVATGEHCQNRVIFKQFITSDALDVVQIDACRLASLNEILAVFMVAAKYNKIVCPHAGGVGLCEYVQHLSMIDYTRISAEIGDRVLEYADHLHEHFEDPVIISDGHYIAPEAPGFSVRMKADSVAMYTFPDGPAWTERQQTRA